MSLALCDLKPGFLSLLLLLLLLLFWEASMSLLKKTIKNYLFLVKVISQIEEIGRRRKTQHL